MKWIRISGSWRASCPELEKDVEREVNYILDSSNGIITGGALGVDYRATRVALRRFPNGNRIRVILPTSLDRYISHYQKRAVEGVITHLQADSLIAQLKAVQSLQALVENIRVKQVDSDSYYARNGVVVNASDELLAFQVNGSAGTQDTIDKALQKGIPVHVFRYIVAME